MILLTCLISLPGLTWYGEGLKDNNEIETWLPGESAVRKDYEEFCRTFGADESILIGFRTPFPATEQLNALSGRLRGLKGVSSCWTRSQVVQLMTDNEVDVTTANERIVHLLTSPNGDFETLLVILDKGESATRKQLLADLRGQLEYCQIQNAIIAGAPVVASQLDELGSRENTKGLFILTLAVCGLLLHFNIGCWRASLGLMGTNVLSIQVTLTLMRLLGMEMNFILASLPVMVMVFTTGASIHFIGQYNSNHLHANGLARAMSAVLWPSLFAAITTIIGLLSLAVSEIGPIRAFGKAGALGTVVSFFVGVGLTPAVIVVAGFVPAKNFRALAWLERFAVSILNHPYRAVVPILMCTTFCAVGMTRIRTLIDPLEFLPANDQVLKDTTIIKDNITSPTSIEAMIDFSGTDGSFVTRLKTVKKIEHSFMQHSNVCHTLSLADFFPVELNEQNLTVSKLLASSGSEASSSLIADGTRLWRISIRLHEDSPGSLKETLVQLQGDQYDAKVRFTGLGPLLEQAQSDIFEGFWQSFASAFLLITVVMMMALRSFGAGLVAMLPNIQPLILVFGIIGWMDYPIDIGIMMTASIALGLAVDGTFHFLFHYQSCFRATRCRYRAVRRAFMHTGLPILSSGLISGVGLLALGLSPFRPTMRFGVLMFFLLMAAMIGDLILMPAFLAIRTRRKRIVAGKLRVVYSKKSAAA
ncbi:MAG: MMPL family transporter [Planctomyces sp.]|nr:MMPL family transporter [Planctomyces sp.]